MEESTISADRQILDDHPEFRMGWNVLAAASLRPAFALALLTMSLTAFVRQAQRYGGGVKSGASRDANSPIRNPVVASVLLHPGPRSPNQWERDFELALHIASYRRIP